MRNVARVTILLTALGLAAMSAGAESVGLAESGAQFRIQRLTEVIQGNPDTGAVVNQGDLIVSGDAPVRVRLSSGDSVLVGQQSSVSLVDASMVQLETGEMAVAYASGSQMNLHYEDLNFVPLADEANDAKKKVEHRLALRANGPTEIYAAGLNQPFAILSNQAEPVQVAMLGDADVLRLNRGELGKWNVLRMQSNPTAATGGQPSSATGAGKEEDAKGCKCESEVTLTDLQQGAAGAQVIKGMINCRKEDNKDEKQETPQLPSSYAFEIGSGSIRCGQKSEFPSRSIKRSISPLSKLRFPTTNGASSMFPPPKATPRPIGKSRAIIPRMAR